MNNGYLNLPATDELHIEEEIEVINNNEKQVVNDPRRGARTLENSWRYSDGSILLKDEIYQDENGIGNQGVARSFLNIARPYQYQFDQMIRLYGRIRG